MFELPCKQEGGTRVGAITEKTHLSRPAVSHHIKILKDAGVVEMRKEGTKNYYYLETDNRRWQELAQLSHEAGTRQLMLEVEDIVDVGATETVVSRRMSTAVSVMPPCERQLALMSLKFWFIMRTQDRKSVV